MSTTRICHHTGACEITSLPGQSQVAVCHGFFIHENHRKHGNSHLLKAVQRHTLQSMRYDYAICTVSANNLAQKATLTQAGWTKLAEFRNHRSSETTELWGSVP